MIDIFLNTLIFLICCAIGYVKAQDYKCRVINLESLLDGLKNLEDEIIYRKTPLPQALKTVSETKANNSAKKLFGDVYLDLKEQKNCSFIESWVNSTNDLKDGAGFTTDDIHKIIELGKGLGGTDIYGQNTVIERAYKQIEAQLEEAVLENSTKGKMYKSLGIAIGLTLVVILL